MQRGDERVRVPMQGTLAINHFIGMRRAVTRGFGIALQWPAATVRFGDVFQPENDPVVVLIDAMAAGCHESCW